MRLYILITLLLCAQITPLRAVEHKTIVFISHQDVKDLTVEHVKSYYTLQRKLFPNGSKVQLCMLPLTHPDTIEMTQSLYEYFPYQLSRVWDRQIFTGHAELPKQFSSREELINYVHETVGTIGYLQVPASQIDQLKESVNVVTIE